MMMPKERLRRLPISQPRVKWSAGASSCSRCSTTEVGRERLGSGGGVCSLGLLTVLIEIKSGRMAAIARSGRRKPVGMSPAKIRGVENHFSSGTSKLTSNLRHPSQKRRQESR